MSFRRIRKENNQRPGNNNNNNSKGKKGKLEGKFTVDISFCSRNLYVLSLLATNFDRISEPKINFSPLRISVR